MRASVSAMRAVPERAGAEAGRAAQPTAAARPRPEKHPAGAREAQGIPPTLAPPPGRGGPRGTAQRGRQTETGKPPRGRARCPGHSPNVSAPLGRGLLPAAPAAWSLRAVLLERPGGPMPSSDAVIPCRALALFALAWCVGACAPRGEGSEPASGPPVWLLARQKEQIAAGAASRVFHGFGFADRVDESGITFTRSAKPN